MKTMLTKLWNHAYRINQQNILELVASTQAKYVCDLGCNDGWWTNQIRNASSASDIWGVDTVEAALKQARSNYGVHTILADLNGDVPMKDASFDLVHANQVIEHIGNLDKFMSEIYRLLKPGGYAVISTENGSSWHNVFASLMGWQMFSLTNVSTKSGAIGNPLSIHRNMEGFAQSWTHKTIFNYVGLLEFCAVHGLKPVKATGAGYHPLPAGLGKLDPRHSHFISILAKKL